MEIKKYIVDYEKFIVEFENSLKEKYQINDVYENISIIKKNDNVNNYQYNFHGAGCSVNYDNIICEYDFRLDDNSKYQFSLWKLKTFIESYYQEKIEDTELRNSLEELVAKDLLKKLVLEGKVFDIYLIL